MVVIALITVLIAFLIVARWVGDPVYTRLGLIALGGHAAISTFIVPKLPYDWDFGNFDQAAMDIASGGLASGSDSVASFGTFQGLVYVVFGADPTNVAIISGFLAVLVPLPLRYLARYLYGQTVDTDLLTVLALFLPLPFLFTSLPMRDGATALLVVTTMALVARVLTEGDLWMASPLVALLGILALFRIEWGLVVVLGTCAGIAVMVYDRFDISFTPLTIGVTGLGIGAVAGALFAEIMYDLDRLNAELTYRADGGAIYLDGMEYVSWFDVLLAAPGRALYFQFAPFPLHVQSAFHLMALLSSLYVIVLILAAIRSAWTWRPDRVVLTVVVVAYLTGLIGYGIVNSNFGTNVRHRVPFEFLLLAIASPTIARWDCRLREWLGESPRQDDQHDRH